MAAVEDRGHGSWRKANGNYASAEPYLEQLSRIRPKHTAIVPLSLGQTEIRVSRLA